MVPDPDVAIAEAGILRHQRYGWWSLLVFLTLGLLLEALHGLKIAWYLGTGQETRRLMWTLAHAHGTLLALVNIVFAEALRHRRDGAPGAVVRAASASLLSSSVLLPGGFFVGGLFVHDGDPGLGVLLSPPGGLLLIVAVLLTALYLVPRGSRPG